MRREATTSAGWRTSRIECTPAGGGVCCMRTTLTAACFAQHVLIILTYSRAIDEAKCFGHQAWLPRVMAARSRTKGSNSLGCILQWTMALTSAAQSLDVSPLPCADGFAALRVPLSFRRQGSNQYSTSWREPNMACAHVGQMSTDEYR